jgi:hypothetical protein
VVGGLVALAMLVAVPGRDARAETVPLSTGASSQGDGAEAIDTVWRIAREHEDGRLVAIDGGRIVTGTDLPRPPQGVASGASHWLTPADGRQDDSVRLAYVTKFKLTRSQAEAASLDAHWSAGDDAVEVTLNGASVFRSETDGPAFQAWHDLTIDPGKGFRDGVNVLEFRLINPPRGAEKRSYFRLEGAVTLPSEVPEPATLILSTASTLILAGLSWKRRLARRND